MQMKVLVVEDDMLERRALEKMLNLCFPHKFSRIALAMDGRTGLGMMEIEDFDLVILDINLPDTEGTEILRIIGENYPDTKVIMATAYSDYEHLRNSMRNNAFDYLVKPYSMETFKESVGSFIDSEEKNSFGQTGAIGKVKSYVEANYMKQIGLDDIASAVGLEKSYLGRVFKKSEGKSIMAYVEEFRMGKADSLIRKGKTVAEAASEVGFSNPAYFSKRYKILKGRSPSAKKVEIVP